MCTMTTKNQETGQSQKNKKVPQKTGRFLFRVSLSLCLDGRGNGGDGFFK